MGSLKQCDFCRGLGSAFWLCMIMAAMLLLTMILLMSFNEGLHIVEQDYLIECIQVSSWSVI